MQRPVGDATLVEVCDPTAEGDQSDEECDDGDGDHEAARIGGDVGESRGEASVQGRRVVHTATPSGLGK